MPSHDVPAFLRELNSKLATRSRHVCVLLGAGASKALGLPDLSDLENMVLQGLAETEKTSFEGVQGGCRNIEQVLSRLRRIATLLDGNSDKVDGLTAKQANDLDKAVCEQIVGALNVGELDLAPMLYFASWLARADYHLPVEVFTVNYDLSVETALESLGVPYFDGFIGSLRAHFRTEFVEANPDDEDNWLPAFMVRLWKLHGSVNWRWNFGTGARVVRTGSPVGNDAVAAIYPSDTKYDESRRIPFVVLQDRFRRALGQAESMIIISGYSFGDEHINELIFDSARRRPRSEFTAFCFDEIPESLSAAALRTPNLQAISPSEAILGAIRADWKDPAESEIPEGTWLPIAGQDANGFALGNFKHLARYLAQSSPPLGEVESRLEQLLREER